jgi:hypothetical protein
LVEGAGRELARLLLTDERAEDAMLALRIGERARKQIRGVIYGALDHQVHASWIRGMASGGGWIEGQGRQSSRRVRYAITPRWGGIHGFAVKGERM